MTTSCSKPVSRIRRSTAPKGDGWTLYLNPLERLASTGGPTRRIRGSAAGGLGGRSGRRRRRPGDLLDERAGREIAREALPDLLRLVLVPHLVLREARVVEDLVHLREFRVGGDDAFHAALGRTPGRRLHVEVPDGVLVLGEKAAHHPETEPGLGRVRRIGIREDELAVRERRVAGVRLLAVGPLGLLVGALGEAEERVIRPRVRGVAVPEVLVPHARLEIAERRLLVEVRVRQAQGGLLADRVVRVVLGHEAQVLAADLVFLLLNEGLALRVGLLLRRREELPRHLGRRVAGRAAGRTSQEEGEAQDGRQATGTDRK